MRRNILWTFLSLVFLSVFISRVNANWYAGGQRMNANGLRGNIAAPYTIDIVPSGIHSGESNWVTSVDENGLGKHWVQAGWRYYYNYSWNPQQYYEFCKYCGTNYAYYLAENVAPHYRGQAVFYQVKYEGSNGEWCAYTDTYKRNCLLGLHYDPVTVMAKSEVHVSPFNSLDTIFGNVQYLDANTDAWRDFDNVYWVNDFPYDVDIYSNDYFRTYRTDTSEVFIPLCIK